MKKKKAPKEKIEIFDMDAKEMVFEEDIKLVTEPEEVFNEDREVPEAPKTHDVEEAIPGTLEEV